MAIKTVLFYWSKGAEVRRAIVKLVFECSQNQKPCYLNIIAKKLKMSHVAAKKHVDLLVEEKYLKPVNPSGKPIYLELTATGTALAREFVS